MTTNQHYVICTRVSGYTGLYWGRYVRTEDDGTVILTGARCCLYWTRGGPQYLASHGPDRAVSSDAGDRVSATVPGEMRVYSPQLVMEATADASQVWADAPIWGVEETFADD